MKIPRDVSGRTLIKLLCRKYGYREINQEGSHAVLATEQPSHQRIAVPDHKVLRIGTLNGILRTVAQHKGIDRSELLQEL